MCVDTFAAEVKMFINFVNSCIICEFHFGTVQLSAVRGDFESLL